MHVVVEGAVLEVRPCTHGRLFSKQHNLNTVDCLVVTTQPNLHTGDCLVVATQSNIHTGDCLVVTTQSNLHTGDCLVVTTQVTTHHNIYDEYLCTRNIFHL